MTRLIRGRGVNAASFSRNSTGSKRRCVVPSAHSAFKVTTTRPSGVSVRRSWATGGGGGGGGRGAEGGGGAVVGRDGDAGVEVEPLEMGPARSSRGDPGGVGLAADLEDAGAGAWPEGDAALHGRAADAGVEKTPSRNKLWKWTLSWRPPPKRWITVTAPLRPLDTPRRRARRR